MAPQLVVKVYNDGSRLVAECPTCGTPIARRNGGALRTAVRMHGRDNHDWRPSRVRFEDTGKPWK